MPMTTRKRALETAKEFAFREWGQPGRLATEPAATSKWIRRNTLDPSIHEAVFHYLRAQNLLAHGFDLEALVAFDCVLQSVESFLRTRGYLSDGPPRPQICKQLRLTTKYADLAEWAYFLRNNFGAHAGGWRWWDHAEILGGEKIASIAQLATKVVSRAADIEPKMRLVNPSPREWTGWFFENFNVLWDAVWFEKFDQWANR